MDATKELMEKIQDAEFVLIGIGEEFNENFGHIDEYPEIMKLLDAIQNDDEKKWRIPFLEKEYLDNQITSDTIEALKSLSNIVKDKNYFVVTTCIDGNITKAGFCEEKIVEPCGNYKKLQCSEKCSTDTYPVEQFENEIKSMKEPKCPKCGKPLVLNNIICENYVEDGYLPQWEVYTKWLQRTLNRKLCIIELGVGFGIPSVIRWPFEKVAYFNQKASFFRIHGELSQLSDELKEKGISIEKNAIEFLNDL